MAENIQKWWDIEIYASKIKVVSQSKKVRQAQKMLEGTKNFTGEWYEVGKAVERTRAESAEQFELRVGSVLFIGT